MRAAYDTARSLSGGEREAFVTAAFPNEPELAELLVRMVAGSGEGFLEPPTSLTLGGAVEAGAALQPGMRLGDFELIEVIGAGGMGEVWRARQGTPARDVAVKVLRGGLVSARARQRFLDEAASLARLSHPGIARVIASGVHEPSAGSDGAAPRPWFAMELVEGARDVVAHARELELGARLELFVELARAVHHGHLRGVIHRDLKPDNVLVDGDGRPRVIDFGVARVTDEAQGEARGLTAGEELLGTLAYMAPEQVAGRSDELDLRVDVFALGVLLHELLTGRSPWSADARTWAALAKQVCEVDPAPPSALVPGLSRELDWIVLRAMAKDPGHRYPSAETLAADVERFLRGEPLVAGPDTLTYQLQKWVRRRRALAAGLAVAVLAILLGTAGTGWGFYKAIQRGDELAERGVEIEAQRASLAESKRQLEARTVELERSVELEQERLRRALVLNAFLNETLRLANPMMYGGGSEMPVGEMLELAADRVGGAFPDQPLLRAETELLIGTSLHGQGRYARAAELIRSALAGFEATGSDQAVRAQRRLAVTLSQLGDWQGAHDTMLAARERGADVLPPDAPELFALDNDWGWLLQEIGRVEESLPFLERGIEGLSAAGPEYRALAAFSAGNLARGRRLTGQPGAEEAYRMAVDLLTETLGPDSASVGIATGNYANFLYSQGRLEECLTMAERAVMITRAALGEDHPALATQLYNLAAAQQALGHLDDALSTSEACIALVERTLGVDHMESIEARGAVGYVLMDLADFERAEAVFGQYVAELTQAVGPAADATEKARLRHLEARARLGEPGIAELLVARYAAFAAERPHLLRFVEAVAGRLEVELPALD